MGQAGVPGRPAHRATAATNEHPGHGAYFSCDPPKGLIEINYSFNQYFFLQKIQF